MSCIDRLLIHSPQVVICRGRPWCVLVGRDGGCRHGARHVSFGRRRPGGQQPLHERPVGARSPTLGHSLPLRQPWQPDETDVVALIRATRPQEPAPPHAVGEEGRAGLNHEDRFTTAMAAGRRSGARCGWTTLRSAPVTSPYWLVFNAAHSSCNRKQF